MTQNANLKHRLRFLQVRMTRFARGGAPARQTVSGVNCLLHCTPIDFGSSLVAIYTTVFSAAAAFRSEMLLACLYSVPCLFASKPASYRLSTG